MFLCKVIHTIQLKLDGGNELCSYACKVIHRLTIQLKLDGGNELCSYVR